MMDQEAAGQWSLDESEQHINVLELKAGLFGLKSLCKDMKDTAIMLHMEHAAVAYVNKTGGSKSEARDFVAKEILNWGISKNIWLTASHIPGINNSIADGLSRGESTNKEWSLDENTFKKLLNLWDSLEIDMFASDSITNSQFMRHGHRILALRLLMPSPSIGHNFISKLSLLLAWWTDAFRK